MPGLSIALTGSRDRVRAGERLTYTVLIKDAGTVGVPHLRIVLTLSPYARFVAADGSGLSHAGKVTWRARLRAGHSLRLTATARVARIPRRMTRLASVACALLGTSRPAVCSAYLASAPAAAAAGSLRRPAGTGSHRSALLYVSAGLIVITIAALALTAGRARARRGRRARV